MGKFNLKNAINTSKIFVDKHSPEILTSIGITGMIGTTVMAVAATPKALRLIEDKKEELDTDELTKREVIQSCWKCYVPSMITGAASIACLIGATSINNRRNVVLATAYKISESTLKEYRDKVVDVLGEEKEQEIRDEIAKDRVQQRPISENIIIPSKGDTLCYDSISGRYFNSDVDKIRKAENKLNKGLLNEPYMSLNDFYDFIGLPATKIGEELGWKYNGDMVEIEFSTTMSEDDRPCIVISYSIEPIRNYHKLM